jgi:predicted nucleic acid-binding protein
MEIVFGDTFFFLASINARDRGHAQVSHYVRNNRFRIVTTYWVMAEVGSGFAKSSKRNALPETIEWFSRSDQDVILPLSQAQFDAGLTIYQNHEDKTWSLTDCISFAVMREHGITVALTADHHFEQAGFTAVFAQ